MYGMCNVSKIILMLCNKYKKQRLCLPTMIDLIGLFPTLTEMTFSGKCGLELMTDKLCLSVDAKNIMETLFNEGLGVVFQVRKKDELNFHRCLATCGPQEGLIIKDGRVPPSSKQDLTMYHNGTLI